MTTPDGDAAVKKRRSLPVWAETVVLLVLALLVSAIVKTFFVQMFFVPSGSMRPLFVEDDRILVQKISYWTATCSAATSWCSTTRAAGGSAPRACPRSRPLQKVLSEVGLYPTGGHLVKRVIGVGGDRVVCCDSQGRVTVNGVPLSEKSYIMRGANPSDRKFDVTVPEGPALGDGRQPRQQRGLPLPPGPARAAAPCRSRTWSARSTRSCGPSTGRTGSRSRSTFENPRLRADRPLVPVTTDPIARLLAGPPDLPVVAGLADARRRAAARAGSRSCRRRPAPARPRWCRPRSRALVGATGRVVVTQPRRIAARAAARRIAHLLGEPVGQTVGYAVRGDRRTSAATRIEVVTTGVLLRRLQRDPDLPGVAAVVLDEVHERQLDADLTLALLVDVRENLRDDLLLVAMSATVEAARTSALLGDAPRRGGRPGRCTRSPRSGARRRPGCAAPTTAA